MILPLLIDRPHFEQKTNLAPAHLGTCFPHPPLSHSCYHFQSSFGRLFVWFSIQMELSCLFATCAHLCQNSSLTGTLSQTWSLACVGFQHAFLVLGQSRGSKQGRFTSRRRKPAWGSVSGNLTSSLLGSRAPLYITAVRGREHKIPHLVISLTEKKKNPNQQSVVLNTILLTKHYATPGLVILVCLLHNWIGLWSGHHGTHALPPLRLSD